jgi:hypothetical protein
VTMICPKTMRECQSTSMCSPFGGCSSHQAEFQQLQVRPNLRAMPFPPGAERVVSMINYKDRLLVATDAGVYELADGAWSRMAFVEAIPLVDGQ